MVSATGLSLARISAGVASVLFVVVIVLQLLLAAGVLPITMAWGGRQETLTLPLRIASVAAACILALLAYVILRRAGLIGGYPIPKPIVILAWVVTVYMGLNTLGNLTSISKAERALFTPISFLLMLSCLLVSISRSGR